MNLLQSIPLATVSGNSLRFPEGATAYLGVLPDIVLVEYRPGKVEQWHAPELYQAIKARLSPVQPAQDWREKIIQLIETATMHELTEKDLVNGDIHLGLFEECVYVGKSGNHIATLWSPEIVGAAQVRRDELLRARRRSKDDAQSEAIERILS